MKSLVKDTRGQVVDGSISEQALAMGVDEASVLMDCNLVILIDASGSMAERDAGGKTEPRTRMDVARAELKEIQRKHPGKAAIWVFSTKCEFCPGGVPPFLDEFTNLKGAVDTVRDFLVATKKPLLIISDGEPDYPKEAHVRAVRSLPVKVSTIYVGPLHDMYGGKEFLESLCQKGGHFTHKATGLIAETANRLLLEAGS